MKTSMQWGAACFATHTGDLFVPNSDSVGIMPGLSDTEALFCINYCLVTHSMVEIAGRLSEAEDQTRIKILKKAVCISAYRPNQRLSTRTQAVTLN